MNIFVNVFKNSFEIFENSFEIFENIFLKYCLKGEKSVIYLYVLILTHRNLKVFN